MQTILRYVLAAFAVSISVTFCQHLMLVSFIYMYCIEGQFHIIVKLPVAVKQQAFFPLTVMQNKSCSEFKWFEIGPESAFA